MRRRLKRALSVPTQVRLEWLRVENEKGRDGGIRHGLSLLATDSRLVAASLLRHLLRPVAAEPPPPPPEDPAPVDEPAPVEELSPAEETAPPDREPPVLEAPQQNAIDAPRGRREPGRRTAGP